MGGARGIVPSGSDIEASFWNKRRSNDNTAQAGVLLAYLLTSRQIATWRYLTGAASPAAKTPVPPVHWSARRASAIDEKCNSATHSTANKILHGPVSIAAPAT